jgi:cob(I)alamin adenosyltransferase
LEEQMDAISKDVTIPSAFIIPGDSRAGAMMALARTIVRRAERHIAQLIHTNNIENRELLRYMNRLSSLFFVLELLENKTAGVDKSTLAKE